MRAITGEVPNPKSRLHMGIGTLFDTMPLEGHMRVHAKGSA